MNRIVHRGLGNFHRAHQAVYTQDARDAWRITAVSFRNRDQVTALRAQHGRYTVLEVGPDAAPPRAISVIDDVLLAANEPERVVATIADPGTTTVTLTVTEKGYAFCPGSHDLDTTDPLVARDTTLAGPPTTTLGLLAAGLLRRLDHGTPIDLVSCDNVGHNGAGLRTVLEQYASLLPSAEAAALTGVVDDTFTAPRPAWEDAGAIVSDEVGAYELVKLRLLNASNSMLAYLGLLTGRSEIAEAAADPAIRAVADRGLGDDLQPTIDLPTGFDAHAYREQVFARSLNHELRHTCQQVGSDGSLKLTQRVHGAVAWHAVRGHTPDHLALLAAARLRVTADAAQVGIPTADGPFEPVRDAVLTIAEKARTAPALAHAVFVDEAMLGHPLTSQPAYVDRAGELLGALRTHPASEVIASMAAETPIRAQRGACWTSRHDAVKE